MDPSAVSSTGLLCQKSSPPWIVGLDGGCVSILTVKLPAASTLPALSSDPVGHGVDALRLETVKAPL